MKLKPCPFCGGTSPKPTACLGLYFVCCNKCATDGPEAEQEELAVLRWNTRTTQYEDTGMNNPVRGDKQ